MWYVYLDNKLVNKGHKLNKLINDIYKIIDKGKAPQYLLNEIIIQGYKKYRHEYYTFVIKKEKINF